MSGDPISLWLAGLAGTLLTEAVKEGAKIGGDALHKWSASTHGDRVRDATNQTLVSLLT